MKKFTAYILAACTMAAFSCSRAPGDPAEAFITQAIREAVTGEVTKVVYNQHPVLVDSVTFAQELENRRKIFQKKSEINWRYYDGFSSKGNITKAEEKLQAIAKDNASLAALEALEVMIKDTLDCIAYYDYEFAAVVKTKDNDVELIPGYACMTPKGEMLTLTTDKKLRHRNIGKVIPGYLDAIQGNSDEEYDSL